MKKHEDDDTDSPRAQWGWFLLLRCAPVVDVALTTAAIIALALGIRWPAIYLLALAAYAGTRAIGNVLALKPWRARCYGPCPCGCGRFCLGPKADDCAQKKHGLDE